MFEHLSIGTNIAKGYSFAEALGLLRKVGFDDVEIASIAGVCEHAEPSLMCEAYADQFASLLAENGMRCSALAGHIELTDDDQMDAFMKKLDFAHRLGIPVISTNAGSPKYKDTFHRNLERVLARAERYGITICLETHGDIVNTARESVKIFREHNHPLLRMTYDTGNVYFYQRGEISIPDDMRYALDYIEHIHLKDIQIKDGLVQYEPIGEGDLNFADIFEVLKQAERQPTVALEIPVFIGGTIERIGPRDDPLSPEQIQRACQSSRRHLANLGYFA